MAPVKPLSSKQELMKRAAQLKSERSTWDAAWRERSEYILPRRSRFFVSDTNKGTRKDGSIINSRPAVAARTLRALMVSGMSSPARRWFLGTLQDTTLRELESAKAWCFEVESKIREVLKKSNIYQCLGNVYGDEATFGTAALHVEEDPESVIRGYVLPIGSYSLDNSSRLTIDTCFHEERLTVKKMAEQFGLENCSRFVNNEHKANRLGTEVDVVHAIYPNPDYEPGKIGPAGMPVRSCWFEATDHTDTKNKFLREGGYHEMPLFTPRWSVTGVDVYGSDCPGEQAIGDAKTLQRLERRGLQAFDKVTNPPVVSSTQMVGQVELGPGGVTIVEGVGVEVKPLLTIHPGSLDAFERKTDKVERQIDTAYYADLALMMQRIEAGKMTATEVTARQQEQMLLLGEVNERNEEELLRPLLYRVFMILYRRGELPPVPQELRGQDLKWDFVSVMSQAQKLLGTANIERLLSLVGNLSAVAPEALDKIDFDQAIDEYADALAVTPSVVRSDDEVAAMRQKKAQMAQQAQAQQQLAAQVEGAKVLSETDTSGDNALTRLLGNVTGSPAPGSVAA